MRLSSILKYFTVNDIKKTGLKGIVKFRFVDFNTIDTNDILNIHNYLIKGKQYKIMFQLIKKTFIGLLTGIVIQSVCY